MKETRRETQRERERRGEARGKECETRKLCEECESRAGMREGRAELGEGTILGKTILGS